MTSLGRQFISEEFGAYFNECGVEHRLSPPIWPQANGEIERQNKTLLKCMRIANAEGKDWKSEIHTFLLAYRSTPNETTVVSPAKLIFNREIRTKIPSFKEEAVKFQEVKDRDAENKQKGKDYADQRRRAVESEVVIGDKVLMERPKLN